MVDEQLRSMYVQAASRASSSRPTSGSIRMTVCPLGFDAPRTRRRRRWTRRSEAWPPPSSWQSPERGVRSGRRAASRIPRPAVDLRLDRPWLELFGAGLRVEEARRRRADTSRRASQRPEPASRRRCAQQAPLVHTAVDVVRSAARCTALAASCAALASSRHAADHPQRHVAGV
jgi:hypothetical protein